MKKLLIIKTGKSYDKIIEQFGDFDDCVVSQSGIDRNNVVLWNVFETDKAPDLTQIGAIIITGSHSMVSEREHWSELLASWLKESLQSSIPVLGICYGHQLLADAFGGTAGYHPNGMEIGTAQIQLTDAGKQDPLLGVLPQLFLGHVVHSQSALQLPKNAVLLAENAYEPHHAFRLGDHIWGVQFHPEFTEDYITAYITLLQENLENAGQDAAAIEESVVGHDYGKLLLRRFLELAG